MLKIRLQRVGRRNNPAFRVVVTESTRGPKSGRSVEIVGNYNPRANTKSLKKDRIQYWIEKGAQVSDTVHNILVSEQLIKGKKKNVLPRKSPIVKESEDAEVKEAPKESSTDANKVTEASVDKATETESSSIESPEIEKDAETEFVKKEEEGSVKTGDENEGQKKE